MVGPLATGSAYQNSSYLDFPASAASTGRPSDVDTIRSYNSSQSAFESCSNGPVPLGKQVPRMDRSSYKSQGRGRAGQLAAAYEECRPLDGSQSFSYGYGAIEKGRTRSEMQHSDNSICRPDIGYCAPSGAEASSSGLANIDSFGVATAPHVPIHQNFKVGSVANLGLKAWGLRSA